MKGTTLDLYWFIIREHKRMNITCSDQRARYLLCLIEAVLMNYLREDEILSDVTYRADMESVTYWSSNIPDLGNYEDVTLLLDSKKEKLVEQFIDNNKTGLIREITIVCLAFRDFDTTQLRDVICSIDSPWEKYYNIYQKWFNEHFNDDLSYEKELLIPKDEIAEWAAEIF